MNKALIVANWKMNKTLATADSFVKSFLEIHQNNKQLKNVVVCPPVTLVDKIKKLPVTIGAQDCSVLSAQEGAYTGDVSAKMLKDLGCEYVIIGHSERRKYYQESNEILKQKILNALSEGLKVIFCIGEALKQREDKSLYDFLFQQVSEVLSNDIDLTEILLAYEPLWAIGTNRAATVTEIKEVHEFLSEQFISLPILYGGSVTSQNAKDILSINKVSGLLIGGASLDPIEFSKIINLRG